MLAVRNGKPIEPVPDTQRIRRRTARRLPGRYGHGNLSIDIFGESDELYLTTSTTNTACGCDGRRKRLLTDGLLGFGRTGTARDELLTDGMALSRRDPPKRPRHRSGGESWSDSTGGITTRWKFGSTRTGDSRLSSNGSPPIRWRKWGRTRSAFRVGDSTTPSRLFSAEIPRDVSSASMPPVSNSSVARIEARRQGMGGIPQGSENHVRVFSQRLFGFSLGYNPPSVMPLPPEDDYRPLLVMLPL